MNFSYSIGLVVKLFLLLTPFFVLSVFIATCDGMEEQARRKLALRTGGAVIFLCVVLYLFGEVIFECLGISLDAFRIGAGLVLMLNGIDMVRSSQPKNRQVSEEGDPAVVPPAIPTTVGPGTIGTLLVMGASGASRAAELGINRFAFRATEITAIFLAGGVVTVMLRYSDGINRLLKDKGVKILTKLTGMYIVALAAQVIFDGVKGFLR